MIFIVNILVESKRMGIEKKTISFIEAMEQMDKKQYKL